GFSYLKHLPVSYLKIDIDFVRDLLANDASRHVVAAVVDLSDRFGLRTIAEGVEDLDTLELLGDLGVDLAQGMVIGAPVPLGEAFGPDQLPRA
ncbi:EAL domain-containing protein, partial [Paraconexibacter sp.]|uniref:EAL domain-containing protein n=1 Tax=Paraconexibacter sp. TaxID=2949640 RepID=UPI003569FC19